MKSLNDVGGLTSVREWRPAQPHARLGAELKSLFDSMAADPMPDRLLQLADALEEAFQRGELFEPRSDLDS
jgi:hypothetical protein